MALIGGEFGYQLLRLFHPREAENSTVSSAPGKTDLDRYFSPETISRLRGCVVIDFGCGIGRESVALAQRGAARVIGLDIQEGRLQTARESAERAGVTERCTFAQTTTERADVILSKDAFEHFRDPAAVLDEMASLLHPDGYVLATFGPTWLHPYGGHLFSVFPWSHLLFTEAAQIRWRCLFKADGATKVRRG